MALNWQQVMDAQADANGLCEATYSVPTNRPVTITRMTCSGDSIVTPPGAQSGQRYRGVWSDGNLIYGQDFSTSPSALPAGWVGKTDAGAAFDTARQALTQPAQNPPPAYPFGWALWHRNTTNAYVSMLEFTPSDLPEFAGVQATRLKVWMLPYAAWGTPTTGCSIVARVFRGAAMLWSSQTRKTQAVNAAWEQADVPLTDNGTVQLLALQDGNGSGNVSKGIVVTGIQVYGKSDSDSYLLNDVVFWKGYLWVCTAAGTTEEPSGAAAAWEQVPGVASSSGYPELRVYRNGVLLDASGNANTDVSDSMSVELLPGDLIRAAWENVSPGARMRLALDGTQPS